MRIAQVAPLWESIPPKTYGGTELVVGLLTQELVKRGHEVTLFAAGKSNTKATLVSITDTPLRDIQEAYPDHPLTATQSLYPGSPLSVYYELQMMEHVFSQAEQFDIIHNHLGFMPLAFANLVETPVVTTLHGAFKSDRLHNIVEKTYYESYAHLPYVSISNYQQVPCPRLNYVGTVYHGLDVKAYEASYTLEDKSYLAFLGRFCEDKGPHLAIQIAQQTGYPLIMAGKVDCPEEIDFFKNHVAPFIDGKQIQYIGELNHPQKVALLINALATLCPVIWPEPFGLVLVESMACGTPVLTLRNGSTPELIRHGETGFIADSVEELTGYVAQIMDLDRHTCRKHVEANFSVERMTEDYLSIFEQLIQSKKNASGRHPISYEIKPHQAVKSSLPQANPERIVAF